MSWRLKSPYSTIGKLIERDGLNCCWCGKRCDENASDTNDSYPTIEHLIPRSKGGHTTMDNCKIACRKCNNARGNPEYHGELNWREYINRKNQDDSPEIPTLGQNIDFGDIGNLPP
jgi:5-methylcytosine-specific restriction endonuclease McrA